MRSKLFEFIKQKEIAEHRKITITDVSNETQLARNTISSWMSDEPFTRIQIHSAIVLAGWIGCQWYELFETVPPEIANEN